MLDTVSADLVTTTVVVVMMGGEGTREFYARFLRCGLDLGDIVGVHGQGLVGLLVDEEVGVVVVADGDGDDLHSVCC